MLLDIDGTLAPIVRHAADAHVPEATRTLLIEIAKRYRLVGCVSGRRASTARQIVAIGTIAYVGQPWRRAAAAGCDATRGRPRAGSVDRARARRSPPTPTRRKLQRIGCASRTRSAIAAFHWRGAPDEERRRAAMQGIARRAQEGGFEDPLGSQGARGASAGRVRQGARRRRRCCAVSRSARRSTSATTRPTSTRFAGCASSSRTGELATFGVRRRQLRRSAAGAGAGGGPHDRGARAGCGGCSRRCCSTVRFVDFLRTTVMLSAGAATALAASRCLRGAVRLQRPARADRRGLVGARRRDRPAASAGAPQTTPPIARLLAGAKATHDAARAPPQRGPAESALAAVDVHAAAGRARLPGAADPGDRGGLRDHLGARLAAPGRVPWRRSRSATERASTCAARRRCGRWRSSERPASRRRARSASTAAVT